MNEKDVGHYYIDANDKDSKPPAIWKMTSFCAAPTATLENLMTGEIKGGAVGCRLLHGFLRVQLPVPAPGSDK